VGVKTLLNTINTINLRVLSVYITAYNSEAFVSKISFKNLPLRYCHLRIEIKQEADHQVRALKTDGYYRIKFGVISAVITDSFVTLLWVTHFQQF